MMATHRVASCKCGHGKDQHEHYRAGSDCSVCGDTGCNHFRRRLFAHHTVPTISAIAATSEKIIHRKAA